MKITWVVTIATRNGDLVEVWAGGDSQSKAADEAVQLAINEGLDVVQVLRAEPEE